MDTKQIDASFQEMINKRGVHEKLGISSQQVRNYRQYLKDGRGVSTDLKLQLLQKYGIFAQEESFTRKELISLLNFYSRTSQAARDNGPEYVIEKWKQTKNKNV